VYPVRFRDGQSNKAGLGVGVPQVHRDKCPILHAVWDQVYPILHAK
jgi:hypothetical protein